MAAKQCRVGPPCDEDVSALQLQDLPLTTGNGTTLCGASTTSHRPFVLPPLRCEVSSSLNNPSHPGSRATDKLVSDRFVWPGMHQDVKAWTRACLGCRRSKVRRHSKAPTGTFPLRMHGSVMSAWTSLYSHPHYSLSSDSQRDDRAVSPSAKGLPTHRTRSEELEGPPPLILLGVRSSLKSDLDCSAAEHLFGVTVRLPGPYQPPAASPAIYEDTFCGSAQAIRFRVLSRKTLVDMLSLLSPMCSSLPASGTTIRRPYRVISRGTKNSRIQRGTREEVVSVDRLKADVPDTPPD
ncbi:hypothetical protein SprV_0802494300 [Sparganum proliferum]